MCRLALLLTLCFALAPVARAGEALVAVATNFLPCAEAMAGDFEAASGERVRLAGGSTGKLAAQIEAGAPFDAFLAADAARPARLEASGHAAEGSRFAYATGRLVLWSADPALIGTDGRALLEAGGFRRLAMANPALAPYGAAAAETVAALGLTDALAPKIVLGENVGQALTMIATGNAELGFVALAGLPAGGSRWVVPAGLHAPLRQDAVLLDAANPAAVAFLDYLRSDDGRRAIEACGYEAAP